MSDIRALLEQGKPDEALALAVERYVCAACWGERKRCTCDPEGGE